MYSLMCTPIVIVPQNYVSAKECRIVVAQPTKKENIFKVEILEAPPVIIQPDLEDVEINEKSAP